MQSDQEVGQRIAKAREFLGLTQAAVAQRMGLARTTQVAVEQGQRTVSVGELQRYAETLERPLAYFFGSGSWAEDDGFRVAFRQLAERLDAVHVGPPRPPGRPRGTLDAPPEKRALLAFESLCREALALQRLSRVPSPELPHLPLPLRHSLQEAEWLAAAVRVHLDRGPDAPLCDLRSALEAAFGLLAFVLPATGRLELAAFHHAELGACVLLRASAPAEARWALARALCHLLVAREQALIGVAGAAARGPTTHFAQLFAGALLAPAHGLRRQLARLQPELTQPSPSAVAALAWHYGVGCDVVRSRLHSLRLGPGAAPETHVATRAGSADDEDPRWPCLPQRFVFLAAHATGAGLLEGPGLANCLRATEDVARQRLATFERGPA
jgi:DNA-binding XRE family transcriptional regulator